MRKNNTNVTLERKEDETSYFPCSVCFEMIEVRYTKKSKPKPYCVCNDCGAQLFVRGKKGIEKFMNLISNYNCKYKSHKLVELIELIAKLNDKLSEIEAKKPVFGGNKHLNLQAKVIKKQLNSLQKVLNNWEV